MKEITLLEGKHAKLLCFYTSYIAILAAIDIITMIITSVVTLWWNFASDISFSVTIKLTVTLLFP